MAHRATKSSAGTGQGMGRAEVMEQPGYNTNKSPQGGHILISDVYYGISATAEPVPG